jgi:hypothetical protein
MNNLIATGFRLYEPPKGWADEDFLYWGEGAVNGAEPMQERTIGAVMTAATAHGAVPCLAFNPGASMRCTCSTAVRWSPQSSARRLGASGVWRPGCKIAVANAQGVQRALG